MHLTGNPNARHAHELLGLHGKEFEKEVKELRKAAYPDVRWTQWGTLRRRGKPQVEEEDPLVAKYMPIVMAAEAAADGDSAEEGESSDKDEVRWVC